MLACLLVPLPGLDPCAPVSSVDRDPHLHFAHGGRADFRGEHGRTYSFLSAPGLAVNIKTEDAVFRMNGGRLVVHGSFITEAHVVARAAGSKFAFVNASFWARELREDNWGWQVITGACAQTSFKIGRRGSKACLGLSIRMRYFSATFVKGGWTIDIRGNHVYDRVAGPTHRLDISFSAARGEARSLPHGIVGQSFSSSAPRRGRVDEYPAEGHFTTQAMAEGAIEGEAAMYEVPFAHAVDFAFSRFEAEPLTPSLASNGTDLALEAAATEAVGQATISHDRRLSEQAPPCAPPPPQADSDSDGAPDAEEGTGDADSDGIPDAEESNASDADSDGATDNVDPDADGDSIPDAEEDTSDADSDGAPDAEEGTGDADSDGIPDAEESNTSDADSDGATDNVDPDADGDSLPDALVRQDPHIQFAHGGQADFRGRNGAYYNFFSAPRLSVNVKTEDALFRLHGGKLIVHGSFLTEAHIVASSSNISAPARASFFAQLLNNENWGWNVINGTCKHRHFQFGRSGFKQCGDLRIEMAFSHATFNLGNWTITVRGNHVYSWISGPKHRVDVSFSARGDAATRSLPHGIIGQSFASAAPRYGLLDDYPKTGEFTTSAMAEGAIEGEATMYEMPSSHATDYAFSRFHKAEAVIDPDPLLALGASAATVQDV